MQNNFRHGVDLHCNCMYAIAVLTQLSIENGHPLFNVAFRHYEIEAIGE